MPNVLDTEETLIEIQELPTYDAPQPAPRHTGFLHKIITALKGSGRGSEYSAEFSAYLSMQEMPLDTTARKYPYLYADALFGC